MTRSRFLLFAILAFTGSALFAATAPWQSNPHGSVRLISEYDVAPSSGPIRFGLQFKPQPGWYYYWKQAGEAGIPPKIKWKTMEGFKSPELLFPAPTRLVLPGEITEYGYLGDTVYPVVATATGQPLKLVAELSYLTCNTSCIPYKYEFTLTLPQGAPKVDADSRQAIQKAVASVPPSTLSDADIQAKAPVVRLDPREPERAPISSNASLGAILLVAFLGGLILNVMPCVLPVLSIKLLGLLQHGGQSRWIVARDALASAAGILISFMALALAAIAARSAGVAVGWGNHFQQPVFVGALMVVMIAFALNLWGVFEIQLPRSLARLGAASSEDEGMGSFFVSGLLATLLATPCSAPYLGTALGFALVQPPSIILLIFFCVGVGLAFPYFALAVFPGTIQWLPRPGAWMLRVKQVMGLLLAGTALWLGTILVSQLTKHDTSKEIVTGTLRWQPFSEAAITDAVSKGQRVFVDVTADWCVTCKVNEKTVLQRGDVAKALAASDLVLLRADWTNSDPAITAFLQKYGRAGIPFYAIFAPGKEPVLLSEFLTRDRVLKALSTTR